MASTNINPQSDSPLFKLPPELRNRIFNLVLQEPTTIHIHDDGDHEIEALALLETCRLVRADTEAMLLHLDPTLAERMTADMEDLTFTHVIDFFKSLTEEQVMGMTSHRGLNFTMTITKDWKANGPARLIAWLRLCADKFPGVSYAMGCGRLRYDFSAGPALTSEDERWLESQLREEFEQKGAGSFKSYQKGRLEKAEFAIIRNSWSYRRQLNMWNSRRIQDSEGSWIGGVIEDYGENC